MSVDLGFRVSYLRVRFSLVTVIVGLFVFVVGLKTQLVWLGPQPRGWVYSNCGLLIGLALICIGGYVGLVALWGREQRSIVADIGLRLVGTGYVIAVFTGMADIFGLGSQPLPMVPYFGPWQAVGVLIGQAVIALGLLMTIPYPFLLMRREQ